MLAFVYVGKGSYAQAIADLEKWRRIDNTPYTWAAQAYVYGRWGQQEQARHALRKFEELSQKRQVDPEPGLLAAYVGMGDKDRVFAMFEKACAERSNVLDSLKVEPNYDPLRSDPRFQDLLRRVGLAQ
jgi:tetratricopeptide (TPR) repeat protein